MVEGIIFDLDGTLLNTVEDIMDSTNEALKLLKYPTHTLEEYYYFIGDGIEELVKRALPEEKRNQEEIKRALELVRAEYKKRWNNKTRPYDGILEMLKEISKFPIKKAIFSNKPHDFTVNAVEYYFKEIEFDLILGSKDGNPKKPDPFGALLIAKELSIEPNNIVYLGDTATDIITAKRANMISVGAEWGFRGREELEKANADYIIKFPMEFVNLVKDL